MALRPVPLVTEVIVGGVSTGAPRSIDANHPKPGSSVTDHPSSAVNVVTFPICIERWPAAQLEYR